MLIIFLLFITIVFSSALCSMAEAAFLSLPIVRARMMLKQGKRYANDVVWIKENISFAVASIVIINNAINIVGSIFVGQQVTVRFGNQWLGLVSTVLTFSIIVVSEIIPKTIGERYKARLSLLFAPVVRSVVILLRPFVALIIKITHPFLRRQRLPKVTEEEIKMMLKLGRAEGTVEIDEEVLCNRVFKLNDVKAYQIMKPIDQIYALEANKTLGELKDAIINSRFSRIAVYNKNPKDFVGVVQHRILLREIAKDNYTARVRDFMSEPIFVNCETKADALLAKFQVYHQHLFIVQDSSGKDVGLVTMEDVLEELFGEIYDEKDIAEKG